MWVLGRYGTATTLLSVDTLVRNALISGATADYSGGVSASSSLDYPEHKISYKDIITQVVSLMAANALHSESGKFMVVIHPHTLATLLQDETFVNMWTAETNPEGIRMGRMGTLMQCDFYISSNAYEVVDAGAHGTEDVYGALFFGRLNKTINEWCVIAEVKLRELLETLKSLFATAELETVNATA